jgi:hypothetical protein
MSFDLSIKQFFITRIVVANVVTVLLLTRTSGAVVAVESQLTPAITVTLPVEELISPQVEQSIPESIISVLEVSPQEESDVATPSATPPIQTVPTPSTVPSVPTPTPSLPIPTTTPDLTPGMGGMVPSPTISQQPTVSLTATPASEKSITPTVSASPTVTATPNPSPTPTGTTSVQPSPSPASPAPSVTLNPPQVLGTTTQDTLPENPFQEVFQQVMPKRTFSSRVPIVNEPKEFHIPALLARNDQALSLYQTSPPLSSQQEGLGVVIGLSSLIGGSALLRDKFLTFISKGVT